jgi:hypothetical protein
VTGVVNGSPFEIVRRRSAKKAELRFTVGESLMLHTTLCLMCHTTECDNISNSNSSNSSSSSSSSSRRPSCASQ